MLSRTSVCAAITAALSVVVAVVWAQPIVPTRLSCSVLPSANPLAGGASALSTSNGCLYIARPDGSITVYDIKAHAGYSILCTDSPFKPTAISAGNGCVWWVTDSPQRLVSFKAPDREVTCWDLSTDLSSSPVRGLYCWKGNVILLQDRGARLLDPNSGEVVPLENFFPAEIASALKDSLLTLIVEEERLLIASAQQTEDGVEISFYEVSDEAVYCHGSWKTPEVPKAFSLSSSWCAIIGPNGAYGYPFTITGAQPETIPIPKGKYGSSAAISAKVSFNHLWWTENGVIFHAALGTDIIDAYLPWNENDLTAKLVAPTPDGDVWVATGVDVRRVSTAKVDNTVGHSGFVRADLRDRTGSDLTSQETRLAALAADWQTVPYKWGGSTKVGTDCSGFVMAAYKELGIALPHGSASLATCSKGKVVRDELRFGDVIVEPGHASLYLGGGRTAETLPKVGLGYGVIWNKRKVIIRRFIGVEDRLSNKQTPHSVASRQPVNRSNQLPKLPATSAARKPTSKLQPIEQVDAVVTQ